MAQRGIRESEVILAYQHGRRIHFSGRICIFLGKRDIPKELRNSPLAKRAEGTVLLVDFLTESTVITVYRNKRALKRLRRKPKYSVRKDALG